MTETLKNPKTKTNIEPRNGQIYLCQKSNQRYSTVKGKFYVYGYNELKTYNKRFVDVLLNGHRAMEEGGFTPAKECPFCNIQIQYDATGVEVGHDGEECARLWDAKVKNYCAECGKDAKAGQCADCGESEGFAL